MGQETGVEQIAKEWETPNFLSVSSTGTEPAGKQQTERVRAAGRGRRVKETSLLCHPLYHAHSVVEFDSN